MVWVRSDSAVLRRLPHLSADAMRFVLALLAFRSLTGKTGIVCMSEVICTQGIAPKSAIINELFEAGVMGQRNDGIVVYHPIVMEMMLPKSNSPTNRESHPTNVTKILSNNRDKGSKRGAA